MQYNEYNQNDFLPVPSQPVPSEPPRKRRGRTAALCLACALLGGVAGGAAARYVPGLMNRTTIYEGTHTPTVVTVANRTIDEPLTLPQIYASNLNSTVGITTELVTTNRWGQKVSGAAAGSGFVISTDGYILTNYHVIEGATSIQVAFANDENTYPATLVGGEAANDIAVLKIDREGLTPVLLGDSDNLVVGEQVCAIGNPLGELTYTLTAGYVSAKDRSITMSDGTVMNMLQTDAAINSGNSGGPLFNMYGQVIGITTAKYSGSSSSSASIEGIGFAIPINDVREMVTDIMEKGYVTGKPNVGILMNDVSSEAQRYGIPAGAYIEAVLSGSCGETAGLKTGDIITAVDDTAVTSSSQLSSAVKNYRAGDTVTFTLFRDGALQELTVTLDEDTAQRSQEMSALQQEFSQSQQQTQQQYSGSWPFSFFGW